jgi:DNA replication protein DnaC
MGCLRGGLNPHVHTGAMRRACPLSQECRLTTIGAAGRAEVGEPRTRRSLPKIVWVIKAHLLALASGDTWPDNGSNLLLFGPPGCGKTHASAALGRALIENGYRVLFMRTTDLVQRLQAARQTLQLEPALAKLDRFDLLMLDDLTHVTKDQAETSVLSELIAARYERRSLLITANTPFGEWNRLFPDPAMTVAAIDRLVHHATIFEMNVESYRRRAALGRKTATSRQKSEAATPPP